MYIMWVAVFILTLLTLWITRLLTRTQTRPPLPPGPSGLPVVGNLLSLSPELHSYFATLARTYGPILSLRLGGKFAVLISSPALAKEVLRDHDITFANRDVPAAARVASYGGHDIPWNPYGPEWRLLRKVCVREMLCAATLDAVYGNRRRELRRTIRYIWSRVGSAVNLGEQMFLTSMNVVTGMLWGSGAAAEREEERESRGREFRRVVAEITGQFAKPNISDFYPGLARFDLQGIEKKVKGCAERFDGIFEKVIEQRMKMGGEEREKDFLEVLLKMKDEYEEVEDDGENKVSFSMTHLKALLMIEQLDLAQEAAPIVDEQLLEDVSHAARSPAPRATPGVGKDINVVMRQTSSPKVGSSTSKATETLRATVSQSQHSVDGPNSLEVATRELTSVAGVDIGTSGGSHERPVRVAAPSTTSFRPGPGSQHIFAAAIRVMGSEYLTTLKNSKFEEVEEKLQGVTMVYKGIERLCGDPTPLRKRVEDYGSAVAAFLSLKKATSSYRHPDDVARERASRIEQIELERSHLAKARADLGAATERLKEVDQKIGQLEDALRLARGERRQLEGDIQVHSSQVEGAEQVVDASSKALTDLEMVPTLSSDDARELERHEQVLLSLQSSLNPDTWMDVD